MTKKNPDDSVHEEQSVADENTRGTEDAIHAEPTQEPDSPEDAEKPEDDSEKIIENEEHAEVEEKPVSVEKEEEEAEDIHEDTAGDDNLSLSDIELPEVDYSGYAKHELVETLGLLIENRPAIEIRDDVERLKILFYKKLKSESEERKIKFLESGGKIEDYRAMG